MQLPSFLQLSSADWEVEEKGGWKEILIRSKICEISCGSNSEIKVKVSYLIVTLALKTKVVKNIWRVYGIKPKRKNLNLRA